MIPLPSGLRSGNEADDNALEAPLDIAIVGGGIVGVMMALGLLHRGMRVTVYEKTNGFQEIGAGFAFTGIAQECMHRLNPCVLEALLRVGEENRHPFNRYWDGFNPASKDAAQEPEALLFEMSARELAYRGCLRSHLLREMSKELPDGVMMFGKQVDRYTDGKSERTVLHFVDGSIAEADAIIGCDGIHSSTRKMLLGGDSLAASARYSHKVAYRAIMPIADGIAALGDDKANNQCAHLGPDAHIVTFPVNKWTLLNLFIFVNDPEPWSDPGKMMIPAKRDEVAHALRDWSPPIREIVDKLPEELTKWAIFDMAEHPAPTYARNRVCLVGDAAHASSPFHGGGACMGVEDALVLVTALDTAMARVRDRLICGRTRAIVAAFQTLSAVRLERSQWLVQSSREMGDIYEWRYAASGRDPAKCKAEVERRSRRLWDFNIDEMVAETRLECDRLLNATL